jgi:hypothetical protein
MAGFFVDVPIPPPYVEDELLTETSQKMATFDPKHDPESYYYKNKTHRESLNKNGYYWDPAFKATVRRIERMGEDYTDITELPGKWISVEHLWLPGDYLRFGDLAFVKKPLIHTSLHDLTKEGWMLLVVGRYVICRDHTKLRFKFFSRKDSNAYLTFKAWVPGRKLDKEDQLRWFVKSNPEPNFSKPSTHTIFNKPKVIETTTIKEVVKEVEKIVYKDRIVHEMLDELAMMQLYNGERADRQARGEPILGQDFGPIHIPSVFDDGDDVINTERTNDAA